MSNVRFGDYDISPKKCKCGCGTFLFHLPERRRGYKAGHEPINNPDFEPDHTEYDLRGGHVKAEG